MNARETFGKRGTNRGAKPMQAVGGPMVRGGLRDNSSTMNSMIINPDPPATTAKQASQGYQNNNSGPQPPAPGQARNDSQNATAPIQHQQQQRPLTSNSGAPARQYSPGVNGNSATNLRSSNPSLSGPIINGSREQLNGDGQGQRSRNPSAAHNARVATGEDTYLNFQHPQPSPPKSDPPPATRTRGSSISNSNGAGVVPNKIGNNNNNGSSNNLSQPSQSTLSRISATEGNSNSNMSTSNDSPPTTNLDAIGNNSPKLGPSLAQQAARSRQSSVGPGQPQAPAIQQQLSMGRPLSAKPAASPTAINQQQISPPQPFTLSRSNSDAANAIAPPVGKSPASMGRAASVGVAPKPMDYDSLHVDYRASFSPNFPQRVSPVRFALLRATNDMFESECLYADHLLTVVEVRKILGRRGRERERVYVVCIKFNSFFFFV